jgi:hypothetical protein
MFNVMAGEHVLSKLTRPENPPKNMGAEPCDITTPHFCKHHPRGLECYDC